MPRFAGLAPPPPPIPPPLADVAEPPALLKLRTQAEAYISAYQALATRFQAAGAKALPTTQLLARSDSVLHALQAQHRAELGETKRRLRDLGDENTKLRDRRERDQAALAPLMALIASLEQRTSAMAAANGELTRKVDELTIAAEALRARAHAAETALRVEVAAPPAAPGLAPAAVESAPPGAAAPGAAEPTPGAAQPTPGAAEPAGLSGASQSATRGLPPLRLQPLPLSHSPPPAPAPTPAPLSPLGTCRGGEHSYGGERGGERGGANGGERGGVVSAQRCPPTEMRSLLTRTPAKGAAAKGAAASASAADRPRPSPPHEPRPLEANTAGGEKADCSALPHFARRSALRPPSADALASPMEAVEAATEAAAQASGCLEAAAAAETAEAAQAAKSEAAEAADVAEAAEAADAAEAAEAAEGAEAAEAAEAAEGAGAAEVNEASPSPPKPPPPKQPSDGPQLSGSLPSTLREAARACGLEGILLGLQPVPPPSRRAAAAAGTAMAGKDADRAKIGEPMPPPLPPPPLASVSTGPPPPACTPVAAAKEAADGSGPRWQKLDVTAREPLPTSALRGSKRREGSDGADSRGGRATTTEQKKRRRTEGTAVRAAPHSEPEALSQRGASAASFDLFAD